QVGDGLLDRVHELHLVGAISPSSAAAAVAFIATSTPMWWYRALLGSRRSALPTLAGLVPTRVIGLRHRPIHPPPPPTPHPPPPPRPGRPRPALARRDAPALERFRKVAAPERPCIVDGCPRRAYTTRSLCGHHFPRHRRYGDALVVLPPHREVEAFRSLARAW